MPQCFATQMYINLVSVSLENSIEHFIVAITNDRQIWTQQPKSPVLMHSLKTILETLFANQLKRKDPNDVEVHAKVDRVIELLKELYGDLNQYSVQEVILRLGNEQQSLANYGPIFREFKTLSTINSELPLGNQLSLYSLCNFLPAVHSIGLLCIP